MKIKYQKKFVEKGLMRIEPLSFNISQINKFFSALLTVKETFNYVPREILEFLEFSSSGKEKGRSSIFARPSDFIDDYMVKMEEMLQNLSVIGEEAFMPGNQEDIV